MKLTHETKDDIYFWAFSFTEEERKKVQFSKFEHELIALCKKDGTVSSTLMALQIFAKAMEKQQEIEALKAKFKQQ